MVRIHLQLLAHGVERDEDDGGIQRNQQLGQGQQRQRGARVAQGASGESFTSMGAILINAFLKINIRYSFFLCKIESIKLAIAMDLNAVQLLIKVAESRSFTQAASLLGTSQSAYRAPWRSWRKTWARGCCTAIRAACRSRQTAARWWTAAPR